MKKENVDAYDYGSVKDALESEGDNYEKCVRTVLCTEICGHMIDQGFTLDQISKSMPWLEKSDIYGLSVYLNDEPVDATAEEIEDIKWEFRRTRKPKSLAKIFNTLEEQAKRRFQVNIPCPVCGEEHAYYTVILNEKELVQMDAFYEKIQTAYHYNDIGTILYCMGRGEYPVEKEDTFICPACKNKFKASFPVYRTDEIGYRE